MAALVFGAAFLVVDRIREKREKKRKKKADNARRYKELERETALQTQVANEQDAIGRNRNSAGKGARAVSIESNRSSRHEEEAPVIGDVIQERKPTSNIL